MDALESGPLVAQLLRRLQRRQLLVSIKRSHSSEVLRVFAG